MPESLHEKHDTSSRKILKPSASSEDQKQAQVAPLNEDIPVMKKSRKAVSKPKSKNATKQQQALMPSYQIYSPSLPLTRHTTVGTSQSNRLHARSGNRINRIIPTAGLNVPAPLKKNK